MQKIWDYYLVLENQFIDTLKYVEPVDLNDNSQLNVYTFSKMYNQLLLTIGSEVDVILKQLCKKVSDKDAENIGDYMNIIKNYKNFSNQGCEYIYNNKTIYPWIDFNNKKSPQWWRDYNNLKHNRLNKRYFKLGNYNNVVNALAGLFVLCRILYREYFEKEPFNRSKIFKMHNWTEYFMMNEDECVFYNTPEDQDKFYK